eukprot:364768-Chlamydomonas_euryale.AAC.14
MLGDSEQRVLWHLRKPRGDALKAMLVKKGMNVIQKDMIIPPSRRWRPGGGCIAASADQLARGRGSLSAKGNSHGTVMGWSWCGENPWDSDGLELVWGKAMGQ